mmetsp:Transcript_43690/g.123709  ORF Transcript_43690/g.123709 Transcript_43690/m.123709 type:complete len:213 (-) Transcript_43690:158-796(-)
MSSRSAKPCRRTVRRSSWDTALWYCAQATNAALLLSATPSQHGLLASSFRRASLLMMSAGCRPAGKLPRIAMARSMLFWSQPQVPKPTRSGIPAGATRPSWGAERTSGDPLPPRRTSRYRPSDPHEDTVSMPLWTSSCVATTPSSQDFVNLASPSLISSMRSALFSLVTFRMIVGLSLKGCRSTIMQRLPFWLASKPYLGRIGACSTQISSL